MDVIESLLVLPAQLVHDHDQSAPSPAPLLPLREHRREAATPRVPGVEEGAAKLERGAGRPGRQRQPSARGPAAVVEGVDAEAGGREGFDGDGPQGHRYCHPRLKIRSRWRWKVE